MTHFMNICLVIICAFIMQLDVRGQGEKGLLKVVDFETGDTSQIKMQKAADDSITAVTEPVRAGKFAARTLLRATDSKVSGGQRAEFSDGGTRVLMDTDYWYGLSIFIPDEFVAPTRSDAVLFQWHTQQGGPSPVLAIRVQGNDWVITSDATGKRRRIKRIPIERNRWTDWVVHARWSAAPTGFWTIWENGVPVLEESKIVTQYPESLGPYAKFGQYHSVGETPRNVVYFDEYRVAGPGSGYEAVAPGGGTRSDSRP